MLSEVAGFHCITSKRDTILSACKRPSKRCVVIFSRKLQAYYVALTKNAAAYYASFASLFRGGSLFGSSELRRLISTTDKSDWEFFIGKIENTVFFLREADVMHYREIIKDARLTSTKAPLKCIAWTLRDMESGLKRVIVSSHQLDIFDLFTRYKKSLLRLGHVVVSLNPEIKRSLDRVRERAGDAVISEDYSGFQIQKENITMEFSQTSQYTKERNLAYFKDWSVAQELA